MIMIFGDINDMKCSGDIDVHVVAVAGQHVKHGGRRQVAWHVWAGKLVVMKVV
jgi:hypothetical protein